MFLLAASMTDTWQRREFINMGKVHYYKDGQTFLVVDAELAEVENLDNKRVAAVIGSTSWERLTGIEQEIGVTFIKIAAENFEDLLNMLVTGQVDAITSDRIILQNLATEARERGVEPIVWDALFSEEPYSMGTPLGDATFTMLVDCTLQELEANKTYQDLYLDWFPDEEIYDLEVNDEENIDGEEEVSNVEVYDVEGPSGNCTTDLNKLPTSLPDWIMNW